MGLAGVFFSLALLCKVWIAPWIVPFLLVPILGQRERTSQTAFAFATLRGYAIAMSAGLACTLLVLAHFDLPLLWDQAFQFHFDARSTSLAAVSRNERVIGEYFIRFGGVTVLAAAGLWLLRHEARIWTASWLAASLCFLWVHTPLFAHHQLLLVPVLSLWGAATLAKLGEHSRGWRFGWTVIVGLWCALLHVNSSSIVPLEILPNLAAGSARSQDEAAICAIRQLAAETDLVGGDDPALIFRSGRLSPANLCDTSQVRIRSGYLRLESAIEAAQTCKVMVLGTGRLAELNGFMDWLQIHFIRSAQFGVRTIWVRRVMPDANPPPFDRPGSLSSAAADDIGRPVGGNPGFPQLFVTSELHRNPKFLTLDLTPPPSRPGDRATWLASAMSVPDRSERKPGTRARR
jgi:hypothetical protein